MNISVRNRSTHVVWLASGAVLLAVVSGCTDRNNNGQPDGISQPAVNNAVSQAEKTANRVGQTAEVVAENGLVTGRIKTAYAANPSIQALAIDVTTQSDKKTVMLQGTVQSAAQKKLAVKIAQQNAPGYQIKNNLKTASAKPAAKTKAAAKTH